jgi:hypothetical protein
MSDQIIVQGDGYLFVFRSGFYGIITPKTDVWFSTLEEAKAFMEGISKLWTK